MSKVVSIEGVPLPELNPNEPVPAVVEELRRMLVAAEAGELKAIAGVSLWADQSTGQFRLGPIANSMAAIGAINVLATELTLLRCHIEDEEE